MIHELICLANTTSPISAFIAINIEHGWDIESIEDFSMLLPWPTMLAMSFHLLHSRVKGTIHTTDQGSTMSDAIRSC